VVDPTQQQHKGLLRIKDKITFRLRFRCQRLQLFIGIGHDEGFLVMPNAAPEWQARSL
jgi:hypothetical protein